MRKRDGLDDAGDVARERHGLDDVADGERGHVTTTSRDNDDL